LKNLKTKKLDMKKLVFAIATVSLLVSCGLPEGGNKGVETNRRCGKI
jgi:hypothetical protein